MHRDHRGERFSEGNFANAPDDSSRSNSMRGPPPMGLGTQQNTQMSKESNPAAKSHFKSHTKAQKTNYSN